MIYLDLIMLIAALAVIAKSTDYVVESVLKLSDFFGIGQMAIGFILISTMTSLPELMVSVLSSSVGQGAISVGNVFGANIADILLVLGIPAILLGIKIKDREWEETAFILFTVTIITVIMIFLIGIDKLEGLVLIVIFLLYINHIRKKNVNVNIKSYVSRKDALKSFIVFLIAMGMVLVSSSFVVESAIGIAQQLNLAKSFIGATLISAGTTLPELALGLQAVRKKKYGLALGNSIGSSMTNLTLVLGTAAIIHPVALNVPIFTVFMAFSIFTNMIFLRFITKFNNIGRKHGIIFIVLYCLYLITLFYMQTDGMH